MIFSVRALSCSDWGRKPLTAEAVCAVGLQHSPASVTAGVIFIFNLVPLTFCLLLEHCALINYVGFDVMRSSEFWLLKEWNSSISSAPFFHLEQSFFLRYFPGYGGMILLSVSGL